MAVLSGIGLVALPSVASAAGPAGVEDCDFGTGGPSADTVCWLRFPDFQPLSAAQVTAGSSENQTVRLGDYTLTFTLTASPGAQGASGVRTSGLPTWDGGVLGNTIDGVPYYSGLQADDYAFYQDQSADLTGGQYNERDTITLSNITMTGPGGVVLDAGWSMVIADAETTSNYEGFVWKSDKPLQQFFSLVPSGYKDVCTGDPAILAGELSGLGTNTVTCRGGNFGDSTGAGYNPNRGILAVQSEAPQQISSTFIDDYGTSRQGVAFGVVFSEVSVEKTVVSRYSAADQFTVSMSTSGRSIASASTSGADTSTGTGKHPLITSTSGSQVSFTEQGIGSTALSHYSISWACTDDGAQIPSSDLVVSDGGATVTANVAAGHYVDCNVSNTALLGSVQWSKTDGSSLLSGSQWTLTGPDGYSANITDDSAPDEDPAGGVLRVGSLPWGDYTLTETQAPSGYLIGTASTRTFSISGNATTVDLGGIVNRAAVPGMHVKKTSDPASGQTVRPGEQITYQVVVQNTGNVDLTPAKLTDDLSDVLDNASYVEGSATATINGASAASPVVNGTTLTWSDALKVGQTATLTYVVTVSPHVTADDKLVNVVVGSADVPPGVTPPTSNCVPGTTDPDCTTTHTPVVQTAQKLAITGLDDSWRPLVLGGSAAMLIGVLLLASYRRFRRS
ncbi:SpaA isopeptide-forming pilin-related protein [Microbacterium sp. SORGH_AS_0888]|uniref:DUF7927 domain-containing protein n=1 Tax=Microbacterium sp. SORGH_AS_0888 TaxID=3041791 RepID=UPI002785C78F|nr:SpaA isopeptide-forming pilin-related protein [Microbacterium sp. SORGH_AS_0888]MDQ1131220.1 putative repeat protein (TIGR01451 family) [Microbacterium sp. SORGH_AS_0888]